MARGRQPRPFGLLALALVCACPEYSQRMREAKRARIEGARATDVPPSAPSGPPVAPATLRPLEPPAAVDVDKLEPGWFGAAYPRRMLVDDTAHVRVSAGRESLRRLVAAELAALPGAPDGGAAVVGQPLRLGPKLRVELVPDSELDFEVRPLPGQEAEQDILKDSATTWEWLVRAKRDGERALTVVAWNPGTKQKREISTLRIRIEVTWGQRAKEAMTGAQGVVGLLTAAAGAIGAWVGLIRPRLAQGAGGGGAGGSGGPQGGGAGGGGGPQGGAGTPPGEAAAEPKEKPRRRGRRGRG